LLKHQLI